MDKKLYIASDHAGFALKSKLCNHFKSLVDLGTDSEKSVDYLDFAHKLTNEILKDSANLQFSGTVLTTHTLSVGNNAIINGNLTVLGTQSVLNTETLKVEDSLIEVGLVNSGGSLVAPSSDANIDVGLIMHYYSGSAKKAAVYWDDSSARVVVAAEVSESTSVLTAAAHAALETGSLWIKDAAGTTETIGYSGGQRILHNITVDGGSF